jgi:EAL domain-containing protein (putative c-di-GMP-specific phosphodiesterase class I)
LIKKIDLWVIENAFVALNQFRREHAFDGKLAINISAVELHNDVFPEQVGALLEKHNIDPARIELELTETSLMNDDEASVTLMTKLKELGVSLALDDFGTGYTAFNQLASYPVDCLKIDKSFVKDMESESAQKHPMVHIIHELAKLYNLHVVAEGVETAQQFSYLREIGCDMMQGYYFSKPLNKVDWIDLLQTQAGHQTGVCRENPDPVDAQIISTENSTVPAYS